MRFIGIKMSFKSHNLCYLFTWNWVVFHSYVLEPSVKRNNSIPHTSTIWATTVWPRAIPTCGWWKGSRHWLGPILVEIVEKYTID